MKIIVLGATGGVGLELVRQALSHGHSVTTFVRSRERLKPFGNSINVIEGDLLDAAKLAGVIEGHDAVLSGFGPRVPVVKAEEHHLERFAESLTSAISQTEVRRAVVVSTAFLFRDSLIPPTYLFGRLFFPVTVADAIKMEEVITKADFDWTLVRPPQLTDKPGIGKYRVCEEHLPRFGFHISRADTAGFMLEALEKGIALRKVVGISD